MTEPTLFPELFVAPPDFTLSDRFPEAGYITREPKRLADALSARGLPDDLELADLFRNFGDILPNTLQRMTKVVEAMDKGGSDGL